MTPADELAALRRRVAALEVELGEPSDSLARKLLAHAPDYVCAATVDGRFLFVNRLAGGLSPDDVIGKSVLDFVAPADHERIRACFARVAATGEPDRYEATGPAVSGALAHFETRVAPITEHGVVTGLVLVATDVTERVELHRQLERQRAALQLAVDATGMGMWTFDATTRTPMWDAQVCRLHGVSTTPLTVEEMVALVHPLDRERVVQAFTGGVAGHFEAVEYRVIHPSGRVAHLLIVGKPLRDADDRVVGLTGGVLDVSERRELAAQLLQAQKMEAVGQLTAGLAHNFNNLLAAILPALGQEIADPSRQGLRQSGLDAARRARDLVRQLMVFAGRSEAQGDEAGEPGAIAAQAQLLAQASLPPGLRFTVDAAPDLPAVRGAAVIEQALLNLVLNARDAIEGQVSPPPRIAIEVARAASGAVRFVVEDSGPGVREAIRDRIFEPFFTTKPPGQGTGLGLAVSFASVRSLGGTLVLAAGAGPGARFELTVPSAEGERGPAPPTRTDRPTRILIVDDEAVIRLAFGAMLEEAGYTVVAAADGAAALRELAATPADLVLLDHSMPGLSGADLVPILLARWPGLRILLISGFMPARLPAGLTATLDKPVTHDELIAAIERALAGA